MASKTERRIGRNTVITVREIACARRRSHRGEVTGSDAERCQSPTLGELVLGAGGSAPSTRAHVAPGSEIRGAPAVAVCCAGRDAVAAGRDVPGALLRCTHRSIRPRWWR